MKSVGTDGDRRPAFAARDLASCRRSWHHGALLPSDDTDRPAPLAAVLAVTFFGSVSGGVFWAAIFFVTAAQYGFSAARNLALAGAMGAAYALAAYNAGRLTRVALAAGRSRGVVIAAFAGWTVTALAPWAAPRSEVALWASAVLGAGASAVVWPIVESHLVAGRHGAEMRSAMGRFNVTWTSAVALALLLMPFVGGANGHGALILSAATSATACLLALTLPLHPVPHGREMADLAIGVEYPYLRRSSAWLLPLSYVLSSSMAPVLPHRIAALGGAPAGVDGGVLAGLWMVGRFLTLLAMWRSGFWHGRWGTLAAALAALAVGLATVLLAPTLIGLAAGLFLFGVGMGLTYYAALYYTMSVGHGAVDAGGSFEALIGLGYCGGPAIGIAAQILVGPAAAYSATVVLAFSALALSGTRALAPYRDVRRLRKRHPS